MTIFCAVLLALTSLTAVKAPAEQPTTENAVGQIAEPVIGGRATWYAASGEIAAAGPALRSYLGRHWRGSLVEVEYRGQHLVVRVSDWCACPRTLLDLSDDAFAQLAPLSRGVINVTIGRVVRGHRVPEPPATDTAP